MAREVVSLPFPRQPIVGTQILSIEQSRYRGNLYEISKSAVALEWIAARQPVQIPSPTQ